MVVRGMKGISIMAPTVSVGARIGEQALGEKTIGGMPTPPPRNLSTRGRSICSPKPTADRAQRLSCAHRLGGGATSTIAGDVAQSTSISPLGRR